MREADMHYEQRLSLDIETSSQNLAENLHLKWSYGLLFVDKYTDEQGLPVSAISGIRREDDNTHYIRIELVSEQKGTHVRLDIWKVTTSGWPFPTMSISTSSKTEKMVDIVEDVLMFCQAPFDNTEGVMPWLRNVFTGKSETRKERS